MKKLFKHWSMENRRYPLELADVYRAGWSDFYELYKDTMPNHVYKTAIDIMECRTAARGGHVDYCPKCGMVMHPSYNSCRNRNCPRCQFGKMLEWCESRMDDLLNVPYFHVIMTIPDEILNPLFLGNMEPMCNVLMQAAGSALIDLAQTSPCLGATPAVVAVLHTWGQQLNLHPHVHMLVSGGGFKVSEEGEVQWIPCRNPWFLLDVFELGKVFQDKFISLMEKAADKGEVKGVTPELIDRLSVNNWVVYIKPPVIGPEKIIKYIGRYIYHTAITNSRLVSLDTENKKVTFTFKDYRANTEIKPKKKKENPNVTLDLHEFIRRMSMHYLSPHFVRVRYLGLYSAVNKAKFLKICKELTKTAPHEHRSTLELVNEHVGHDIRLCPFCKAGNLERLIDFTDPRTIIPRILDKVKVLPAGTLRGPVYEDSMYAPVCAG